MAELYVVLIAMLAAAVVAIEIKDLLAAAVSMGMVGFSVAIAFILVQAPDLAIVQIVVEILTVVFFAAVILRTTHTSSPEESQGIKGEMVLPVVLYGAFSLLFFVLVTQVFKELPAFGSPAMRVAGEYIAIGLQQTGAANLVTAVILDFRAYDTLGEAVVLFTAVVGVLTVVRQFGKTADLKSEEKK